MDAFAGRELTIVGAGRLGSALAASLRKASVAVVGPIHHTEPLTGSLVLLAVPDKDVSSMAARVSKDAIVGHTAGALTLDVLGQREAFSFHPLMTATGDRTEFAGASAAIAGSSPRALGVARAIATSLSMHPLEIPEGRRAEYHAAASIAANFLVALES